VLGVKVVVIGVAGGTASGKSTIVRAITDALGPQAVSVISHDSYYRDRSAVPQHERELLNYDHPDALDSSLLVEHLRELRAGHPVNVPVYDFATHSRLERVLRVEPRPVLIVDGILILADPALRELMDIRVFVDTDADLRLVRRIERDIKARGRTFQSVIRQYLETTRPMHLEFVEPSKRYAHVILPEGGLNAVGVDMLVTKVRSLVVG
jgi:uridine kinase